MVRISKQSQRRAQSPRKTKKPVAKTGPLKDAIPFKECANAVEGDIAQKAFIPKIR